jgi:hypothetical protein
LLYGVDCNYGGSGNSLQLSAQGSFQVDFVPVAPEVRVLDFGDEDWSVKKLGRSGLSVGKTNKRQCAVDLVQNTQETASPATTIIETSNCPSSPQDEHLMASLTTEFLLTPLSFISMNSTMATMIDDSLQLNLSAANMQPSSENVWTSPVSYWHFSEAHFEILTRFRDRTALTIGMKTTAPVYRDLLCHLALSVCVLPDIPSTPY